MQILLVEDDPCVVEQVRVGLECHGFDVMSVESTDAAAKAFALREYSAVVFDRLLADGDAIDTITEWREAGLRAPVLILSSMGGVADRVAGLRAGADDYLVKPFHIEELDARLRAMMRARDRHAQVEPDIFTCGSVKLDRRRREAERAGKPLMLQPREFRLLETLAANCDKVVPRSVLLEKVWNLNFDPRTKIIETHMSRLRDKLDIAAPGEVIETVRGIGYRLRSDA
ncbi:MAG TPA: response regulator transcription factor [Sphingomonas sp.]|nr:response regulator transcription factor [Sphingomonas sp.]